MKILHLIDSLEPGGAEQLLIDVINEIFRQHPHYRQVVVTTRSKNGILNVQLKKSNTEYYHFNCSGFHFPLGILKLKKFMTRERFDVIHAHLYHSVMVGKFAKPNNVKYFYTYHNMDYLPCTPYHSPMRIKWDRITYKKDHTLIFVSEAVKDAVGKMIPFEKKGGKGTVLANFPNPDFRPAYRFKPDKTLKLIAVANLKKVKNLSLQIEALGLLKDVSVTLEIAGDGPFKNELSEKIIRSGGNVKLIGSQKVSSEFYAKYDALIISSYSEGMPIVLLEAMAVGIPVILPDHLPVMKKLAGDGGYYYSIEQAISLADKIREILTAKNDLAIKSETLLQRAKNFSAEGHVKKLISLYQQADSE